MRKSIRYYIYQILNSLDSIPSTNLHTNLPIIVSNNLFSTNLHTNLPIIVSNNLFFPFQNIDLTYLFYSYYIVISKEREE